MKRWLTMTKTALLALLVGVAITRVADASQSEASSSDDQPISVKETNEERRVERPEVVLQLKYDRGELNKIYLTQFRKGKDAAGASVPARTNLCADLCHAGLGGAACGSTCAEMLPVGLRALLEHPSDSGLVYGEPRYGVCPTLCANQLGEPLCNCSHEAVDSSDSSGAKTQVQPAVDWSGVCSTFCLIDGYVLSGCPSCHETSTVAIRSGSSRILNTEPGWVAWCSVQCGQGHGGAACNCERSPLQ